MARNGSSLVISENKMELCFYAL